MTATEVKVALAKKTSAEGRDHDGNQFRTGGRVGAARTPQGRKLQAETCVRLCMLRFISDHGSHAKHWLNGAIPSGQWRAMPDGIDGIHGNGGNVVSVTYRF